MVQNLVSPRSGKAVANQFIVRTENGTFFQSYRSIVAKVDNLGNVTLGRNWDYSRTTLKYLMQFLHPFGYGDINTERVRQKLKRGDFKFSDDLYF